MLANVGTDNRKQMFNLYTSESKAGLNHIRFRSEKLENIIKLLIVCTHSTENTYLNTFEIETWLSPTFIARSNLKESY